MIDKYKLHKWLKDNYNDYLDDYLTEQDFLFEDCYPIKDNRFWKSNVKDINGGDNFADYCKYIFKLYEEEEIDYY